MCVRVCVCVNWNGEFDSFYVPQQRQYLQKPALADILKTIKASKAPCAKPTRVVCTLSTFEGRLAHFTATLASLVNQSCTPDAIYEAASHCKLSVELVRKR